MANHFNMFFTSVSASIVNDINPSDRPPDAPSFNDDIPLFSFIDSPVTATEIIEATNLLQSKKLLIFLEFQFGSPKKSFLILRLP